jgi:predicted DNA-binding protein
VNRTQIYLDELQHHALAALARDRGTTASALIREAIDGYLISQSTPGDRLNRLRELGQRFASTAAPSDAAQRVDALRLDDLARLDSGA